MSLSLYTGVVELCHPLSVQVLRKHVMVRVGGGWDTLEHYLDKHDPCRCNFPGKNTVLCIRSLSLKPRLVLHEDSFQLPA